MQGLGRAAGGEGLLASAATAAAAFVTSHGGGGDEEGLSPAVRIWFMAISAFLVLFAGLMVRSSAGHGGVDGVFPRHSSSSSSLQACLISRPLCLCHPVQAGLTLGLLSLDK